MAPSSDFPEFEAKRDEVAAQLEAALAELAPARAVVEALKAEALAAARKFNSIASRVLHAQRPEGECAPALLQIVDDARKQRDAADGRLSMAKQQLGNIEWRALCLRTDLEQLARLIDPPPPGGPLREIVRRAPPGPQEVDVIVFPAGRATGGDAA